MTHTMQTLSQHTTREQAETEEVGGGCDDKDVIKASVGVDEWNIR